MIFMLPPPKLHSKDVIDVVSFLGISYGRARFRHRKRSRGTTAAESRTLVSIRQSASWALVPEEDLPWLFHRSWPDRRRWSPPSRTVFRCRTARRWTAHFELGQTPSGWSTTYCWEGQTRSDKDSPRATGRAASKNWEYHTFPWGPLVTSVDPACK